MSWVKRVSVHTSPIHGRGVFVRNRIREDQYIGTFHGKVTKRDGPYVLWTLHDDGSPEGIRGTGVLRYPHGVTLGELCLLREVCC